MPKKIYLHVEKIENPVTVPLSIKGNENISSLLSLIYEAIQPSLILKFPTLHFDQLIVKNVEGKLISSLLIKDDVVGDVIEELLDLFITVDTKVVSVNTNNILKVSTSANKHLQSTETNEVVNVISSEDLKNIKSMIAKISTLMTKKAFKQVRLLCEDVLENYQGLDYNVFRKFLADALIESKQYNSAISVCRDGLRIHKALSLQLLLIKALMNTDNYEEALDILEPILNLPSTQWIYLPNEKPSTVVKSSDMMRLNILAMQAECLLEVGKPMKAADIVNSTMANPNAEKNIAILLIYSDIAIRYNKVQEPLSALLKAVTVDQKNHKVKTLLSKLLETEYGFEELLRQVVPSAASISAYTFLATIVKDCSCLNAAIRLYQNCLNFNPSNASIVLNLMHVYEAKNDYFELFETLLRFTRITLTNRNGSNDKFLSELQQAVESGLTMTKNKLNSYEEDPHTFLAMKYHHESSLNPNVVEVVESSLEILNDDNVESSLFSAPKNSMKTVKGATPLKQFVDSDLDIMAIAFTAVKAFYSLGNLSILPTLIRVIEPVRLSSIKPLHETYIRNETAYYQIVAQVLSHRYANGIYTINTNEKCSNYSNKVIFANPLSSTIPVLNEARRNPVYICGDSHSLCPGWSVVDLKGEKRLVIPKLTTGVKQWHLRAESNFYPKANFYNVINSIPDGSTVILIIGEIDCREGMLVAVERDYYPSVPVAMEKTIGLFINVLKQLIASKKFEILIHPVVPVLNETRSLVIAYNEIYRKKIQELKGVQWLDIFDELLIPNSNEETRASNPYSFNLTYGFDGTHMNPSYVSLIERAMNQLANK
eukprot:gene7855-10663_t